MSIEEDLKAGVVVSDNMSSYLEALDSPSLLSREGLWSSRIDRLLSTWSTSPATDPFAMGGQLSRETRRLSVLLAADLLLERAATPSELAGDLSLVLSCVFSELGEGLTLAIPTSWFGSDRLTGTLSKWSGSPSLTLCPSKKPSD